MKIIFDRCDAKCENGLRVGACGGGGGLGLRVGAWGGGGYGQENRT